MRTLYLDTETTGLPRRGSHPSALSDWDGCRLVQVAWSIVDEDNALSRAAAAIANHAACDAVPTRVFIVRPDGFEIPEAAAAIHGIETARALAEGVPVSLAMTALIEDLDGCDQWVAHNVAFDRGVIASELYRLDMADEAAAFLKKTSVCTMRLGTLHGQRWPRLNALYERYFKEPMPGCAHRADSDMRACMAIHRAMLATQRST
jgi:DNA polymerase III epsilon subunit-like protein